MEIADPLQKSREPQRKHQLPRGWLREAVTRVWRHRITGIAGGAALAILLHMTLRFMVRTSPETSRLPLLAALGLGGIPLLYQLLRKLLKGEFGSDLLGGISILTAVLLGEFLAGSIIVLMLAGGEALEIYALRSASSVLASLARRMDESYLTGEPFEITKTSGSTVLSVAINRESALTIRATQRAADSPGSCPTSDGVSRLSLTFQDQGLHHLVTTPGWGEDPMASTHSIGSIHSNAMKRGRLIPMDGQTVPDRCRRVG